ncbi:serine/threonine protein kinase [Planotetraspora thailandica]|uniref:Serine/threonine protein kinase n=1 Tax=Planotetraspora thailandica TaxID=487172 RepID=A0A8J3V3G3_9ACTN|nr:class IV lanthionine synthetase LanL [Planotetraspora thailandica]GII54301.1 serine/threonine protein kinase [Planotetraspora thailandica]
MDARNGREDQTSVDRHVLEDIAKAALARAGRATAGEEAAKEATTWEFRTRRPWTYVTPVGAARRAQGWKLHVSATPLSAPVVLARAVEVLARRRCSFKFAATLAELSGLVSREQDRGAVGKFITVYPADDRAATAIAEELHAATMGLPGPPILSDRAYKPGSLVHYRYGVFSAPSVLDNDGTYASRLTAPDGTPVTDKRNAWYSPPSWAPCPFESGKAPVRVAAPEAVLLADRFVVRQAVRHNAKGGVFLAEDRDTGGHVVVKQARPHVGARLTGRDERDALRHEWRMLGLFGPLGVTARRVAFFDKDDNLFLVQERLEGTVLTAWAGERRVEAPDPRRRETVLGLVGRLVDLVTTVHEQGYIVRDLTPNNVIVAGDGDCRLIDLETAAMPGTLVGRAHTPGYAPPEQEQAPAHGPCPGVEVDFYALGATVFYLVTACQPMLLADQGEQARSWDSQVRTLVDVAASGDPVATELVPMIVGLMVEDPALRWDLARVRAFLSGLATGPQAPPVAEGGHRLGTAEQDRLLHDGLAYTLRTMSTSASTSASSSASTSASSGGVAEPVASARLWAATGYGANADPCGVQYGAAGVLHLMASLAGPDAAPLPQELRGRLTTGLRDGANWMIHCLAGERRPSPGLYFGRAGMAWALYEAGTALDDHDVRAAGLDLALDLPVSWPNPDICHGLAGTGMALLHLWNATGDTRFRDRASACADELLKVAQRTPDTVLWAIPKDFDSALAGVVHYGFAHGVAGIGAYLLTVGAALGREDCLETAVAAGRTLVDAAGYHGGAAWWGEGPHGGAKMPHWCSGSSGIGTFLVRLHAATGDRRALEVARAAAMAVHGHRLRSGTAACHGLAGDGQFLLDLAEAAGEPVYRDQAEELAGVLWARATMRDGLLVVPDENALDVTFGWNTGLAGVLAFMLRLRHGGPRPWMADAAITAEKRADKGLATTGGRA